MRKKILVIDDDVSSLELLEDRLRASGYAVITASDGQRGLERARLEKPNLIIMDVLLPKMNGFHLCQVIKKDSELSSIPVMMLTAVYVEEVDKERGLQVGAERYLLKADAYMSKPFRSDRLLDNVRVLLEERRPEEILLKEKILVIDDDPAARGLLKIRLEKEGYEVITALDGKKGLKMIDSEKPDMVILDIRLPRMSGMDVLTRIKKDRPHLPVVMITAYGSEKIAIESMRKGANDYITKPIDHEELSMRVRENLEKRRLRRKKAQLIATLKESNFKLMQQYEELEKAKTYISNVIKSMSDTLIVVDPDGNIKTVNQATLNLLGYKKDKLIGKPVATIFAKDSIFKGTKLKKLMKEGTVHDYDIKYRTKNGKIVPVSFSGAVMRNKEGELVGMVGIARDMREIKRLMQKEKELAVTAAAAAKARAKILETAKKTLEKRVRKRTKELEKSKRALEKRTRELEIAKMETEALLAELESAYKELRDTQEEMLRREKLASTGSLAAGVAHEIRNPLSVIGMSVQYLHSKFGEDDPRREYTKAVIDKVERLDRVTKELIDFSRPRELNFQTRDLHRSLNNVLTLSEAKCRHQKVKIIKRYAKNIPPIVMDEELMEQVFLNLVSNALEAMPRGGKLLVSTSHLPEEEKIAIEFRDTGRGIASKEKKYIFDPFYSTKANGTGLGLSISQRIIDDHRGSTEVKSRKGRGATFTIGLPISPPPPRKSSSG